MAAPSLLVDRHDLRQTRVVDDAREPLPEGAVRLRIDRFALTSNNITYAAFGEAMHYWDFFPSPLEGFGRIPVWGFADVIESRVDGIAPGERFYGYYPMSTEVVLQPVRVGAQGFVDGAPHRAELAAVYNQYQRCSSDPAYRPEHEAQTALLRPLFVTSFLIDDFLADKGFFDAAMVLLSSASSKTAYGTAFCLAQRRGQPGAPRVVGLTSPGNLAFTQRLGCYDEVVTYDAIASLPATSSAVYVDMSGSAPVRAAVHGHWNERLRYSCAVGGTHWSELGGAKGLPGPRPELFFAPAQIKKRLADWGPGGLNQRIADAWGAFLARLAQAQPPWLRVVEHRGADDVQRIYLALLDGRTPPDEGHLLSLS